MGLTLIVPVLRVADVTESINWYHEMLGFEADPFPELPPFKFAILRLGGHEIMLRGMAESEKREPQKYNWDVYLRLEDTPFQKLYDVLARKGAVSRRLERMFYGMAEFEVTDPDGHVICLGQYLDEAEAEKLPTPEI